MRMSVINYDIMREGIKLYRDDYYRCDVDIEVNFNELLN